MVPAGNLWAFLAASIVLILIPGPSVLFTIGRSLALGRVGGLVSVLGNALGIVPLVIAVAFGVGGLIAQSVVLFSILKLAGAAYLVYLGIQAIRHRRQTAQTALAGRVPRSHWKQLRQGFVVGITNPKTIAFFVAVFPQFVDVHAGSVPLQLTELGVIYVLLALTCDSVWALAAGAARDWFARSPKRIERLSATGGVMMIGLGGVLVFAGSES